MRKEIFSLAKCFRELLVFSQKPFSPDYGLKEILVGAAISSIPFIQFTI